MKQLEIIESETLPYPGDKEKYDAVRNDQHILQCIAREALAPAINKLIGSGEIDWSVFYTERTFQRKASSKDHYLEVFKSLAALKANKKTS